MRVTLRHASLNESHSDYTTGALSLRHNVKAKAQQSDRYLSRVTVVHAIDINQEQHHRDPTNASQ